MRRQSTDTESLVYAYACRQPTTELQAMEREAERMAAFWDKLVAIEHTYEREIEEAAAAGRRHRRRHAQGGPGQ